jgi:hypothetical protein
MQSLDQHWSMQHCLHGSKDVLCIHVGVKSMAEILHHGKSGLGGAEWKQHCWAAKVCAQVLQQ